MSSLFSKPSIPKAPPVPAPLAVPTVGDDVGAYAQKLAQRRGGFASTILTGAMTPTNQGKKRLLGG